MIGELFVDIEPAVLTIFNLPVGSDITLIREGNVKKFIYTKTGLCI